MRESDSNGSVDTLADAEEWTETDERPKRSPWNLLAVPFVLVAICGLPLLAYLAAGHIQRSLVPADTLLLVRPAWAGFVGLGPWFLMGFLLGLWAFNAVAYRIPPLRRVLDAEAAGDPTRGYALSQAFLARGMAFSLLLALVCFALTVNAYSFVRADGVYKPRFMGLGVRHYAWDDVTEVRAECRQYRNRRNTREQLRTEYVLVMRDGARVDIYLGGAEPFLKIYAVLGPHLAGRADVRYACTVNQRGLQMLQAWPDKSTATAVERALHDAYNRSSPAPASGRGNIGWVVLSLLLATVLTVVGIGYWRAMPEVPAGQKWRQALGAILLWVTAAAFVGQVLRLLIR